MWQDIRYNGTTGWTWIDNDYSYDPRGSEKDGYVEYEDLRVWIIHASMFPKTRPDGTIMKAEYFALIEKGTLDEWDLTPIANRTFLKGPSGITYKVVQVLDMTHDLDYYCWYLGLRREQLR